MVVIQQSLATKFSTLQFFGVAVDRKSCSACDEVLEEEHVTATATSSSEDERGQQTGEGDEALEGEGGKALEGEGEGTATRTLYKRGPASLPPVPLPHNHPVIRPMAKR